MLNYCISCPAGFYYFKCGLKRSAGGMKDACRTESYFTKRSNMMVTKTKASSKLAENARNRTGPSGRALASERREIAVQFKNIKNGLAREFGTALGGHGQLLASALNEAEALAWQTGYPHLFFPVLAEEKAVAVNRWAARQRRVQQASREMALAV